MFLTSLNARRQFLKCRLVLNCPWGEISILHKLGFSEISPPQSLLPSNLQILNLILVYLLIIIFIMIVFCCVWQKNCGAVDHNIYFKFEWLCSVLVKLVGSLEENLLPRLQEAQQFLATLDRDDYFNCTSYAPPVIKTGIRGRPKFYIPREQLEYFIEYGFKATYIFKMLHVRVIQSSIRQFNLSHMHNILKMSVA